jgi:hypothetical protein
MRNMEISRKRNLPPKGEVSYEVKNLFGMAGFKGSYSKIQNRRGLPNLGP